MEINKIQQSENTPQSKGATELHGAAQFLGAHQHVSRRHFITIGATTAAAVMVGALFGGCSGSSTASTSASGSSASSSSTSTSNASSNTSASASTSTQSSGSKILVAYFSAQGHTRAVAQAAADELGADIFEIVPSEAYTSDDLDYNNSSSRVSREHDDESLRDIPLTQTTPDGWENYDTVLIGYPIWWGIAAWPTNHFVTDNNFTGKTVIPFCTSGSSSLGESGQLLAQAAGTGTWQEGQRFSSDASDDEVRTWATAL